MLFRRGVRGRKIRFLITYFPIFSFIESLSTITTKQYVKLMRKGKNPTAAPQKKGLVQDSIIENATQLWIRTSVHLRNPLQFLQLCSHCINDILIIGSEGPKPNKSEQVTSSYCDTPSSYSALIQNMEIDQEITVQPTQLVQPAQPQQQIIISRSSSSPPPLAYFPKGGPTKVPILVSSRDPPPLIPFSKKVKLS